MNLFREDQNDPIKYKERNNKKRRNQKVESGKTIEKKISWIKIRKKDQQKWYQNNTSFIKGI